MVSPSAAASPIPTDLWLGAMTPFESYALAAGTVMFIISAAQWLASYSTDRRALRLFSVRYFLAGLGWIFAHPRAHGSDTSTPLAPVLVAIALLALTIWALDEYLGHASKKRLAGTALAAVAAAIAVWLHLQWEPQAKYSAYLVMVLAMTWCAGVSWQASRREHNVGHKYIALAFMTYPCVVIVTLLLPLSHRVGDLAYFAALPAAIVGVTILVVSLIRARMLTEAELVLRMRAEAALKDLNTSLEQRVQSRTKELQVMVEGLESFTRNVSHDLRGPLAGLAGVARLCEQALDHGDAPHARDLMAVIAPQAERLQTMVTDLLTLSRVSETHCEMSAQPLRGIVDDALHQLTLTPDGARELGQVHLQIDPLPSVMADRELLAQVYVNLIGNAARFAAAHSGGKGTVRVGTTQRGGETTFYVSDDGPGFDPGRSGDLFKPFRRLHSDRLSRNGIGLSIVQRIVDRHGGRVWAESRPGMGATFSFTLGEQVQGAA